MKIILLYTLNRSDLDGWSSEGCWPLNDTGNGIISWNCSHLTNFALIINVNQDFHNPFALRLLTYIGCGISIGCLVVTLFIYLSIRYVVYIVLYSFCIPVFKLYFL